MKTQVMRERLDASVVLPIFDKPAEFGGVLKKERERSAEFIRRNKITAE